LQRQRPTKGRKRIDFGGLRAYYNARAVGLTAQRPKTEGRATEYFEYAAARERRLLMFRKAPHENHAVAV
jgi:hypothetical protein